MARTAEDVETYLLELDRRFDLDNGTFLLSSGPSVPPIAIRVAPPIVAVRVLIGPAPADDMHKAKLYTRLLEYNATDLMHASYGIENGTIILSAALALDNLDKNELEATLSDIDVALARHISDLHGIAAS
jgi:hypothetical protein